MKTWLWTFVVLLMCDVVLVSITYDKENELDFYGRQPMLAAKSLLCAKGFAYQTTVQHGFLSTWLDGRRTLRMEL